MLDAIAGKVAAASNFETLKFSLSITDVELDGVAYHIGLEY